MRFVQWICDPYGYLLQNARGRSKHAYMLVPMRHVTRHICVADCRPHGLCKGVQALTRRFRFEIGWDDSPLYPTCAVRETINYLLCICPQFSAARKTWIQLCFCLVDLIRHRFIAKKRWSNIALPPSIFLQNLCWRRKCVLALYLESFVLKENYFFSRHVFSNIYPVSSLSYSYYPCLCSPPPSENTSPHPTTYILGSLPICLSWRGSNIFLPF